MFIVLPIVVLVINEHDICTYSTAQYAYCDDTIIDVHTPKAGFIVQKV